MRKSDPPEFSAGLAFSVPGFRGDLTRGQDLAMAKKKIGGGGGAKNWGRTSNCIRVNWVRDCLLYNKTFV